MVFATQLNTSFTYHNNLEMEYSQVRTIDQEVQHMKELYPTMLTSIVTKAAIEAALKQRIKTKQGSEKKYWQQVFNEIKKLY